MAGLGSAELGSELRPYALGPHATPDPIGVGFGNIWGQMAVVRALVHRQQLPVT